MAEYLEKEAFKSWMKENITENSMILTAIDYAPSADVKPVRHGHWLNDESYEYICSECGKYAPFNLDIYGETVDYYHNNLTNYCPNCGAKMEKRGIK